ncbi:hypothetical protein [Pseudonocardia sediminis]|uniref:hypothetical protein n=1 Tax=Pseudonocardia sediminis TaxID=1397368 RepID=UPI00102A700E|nr:hypothetical protein [Pseudonocardia sediminis]
MSAMTDQVSEPHQLARPADGWTVDDLDRWPESHERYELTGGALTSGPAERRPPTRRRPGRTPHATSGRAGGDAL